MVDRSALYLADRREGLFRDKTQADRLLAERIRALPMNGPLVLAIPRGAVPIAKEVALAIGWRLDLIITKKIGTPGNPEFAIAEVDKEGEASLARGR